MAIEAGAAAIGLVADMPSGPGIIEDDLIREIAHNCPPGVSTFLLTSRVSAPEIVDHVNYCGASAVQIVDAVDNGTHREIKRSCPNVKIVQVVHVRDDNALEQARYYAGSADALLLDSGNPGLAVKELGGTGRVHDWRLSREIVQAIACPVFLAGGLTPDNVREAVQTAPAYGVDVCSGVRTNGKLDKDKSGNFIAAAQSAWRTGAGS